MPIPKKESGETSNKFLDRCMSDEVMQKEYPDPNVRFAICIDQVKTLRIIRKSTK